MAKKTNTTTSKKARPTRVVDPMLVNSKVAEANNEVLDEALADLEMDKENELVDNYDFETEIITEEEFEKPVRSSRRKEVKPVEDDLDDIYADIQEENVEDILAESREDSKKKKKEPKLKKNGKPKMKLWKKILIGVGIVVLGVGIYGFWYANQIGGKLEEVFEGSKEDLLKADPMAKDENGRTNVLIFGTSEDEETHGGAQLADSILVISFDQETYDAKTFSIPRDLWVNYTVAGEEAMHCSVGYKGKINAEYLCAMRKAEQDLPEVPEACAGKSDQKKCRERQAKMEGAKYFARKVSEITGVNIQYFVAVDWTVLITTVDTLGGIDVDVWATDERGISDVCQQIEIPKGMNYGIDGDMALRIARARGACHGGSSGIRQNYGLANSNFDREKNQQRIINAVKNKALNVGVLADPNKVLPIIDTLGDNIRTNIAMSEVRTVLNFATNMKGEIASIETQKLFTTGMVGNQSSVAPKGVSRSADGSISPDAAGLYDYTSIRKYFKEQLTKSGTTTTTDESEKTDSPDE